MKIITLNLWGGKVYEPLMGFLKEQKEDIDVFCFQELMFGEEDKTLERNERVNIFNKVKEELGDFNSHVHYAPEGSCFEARELEPGLRVGMAIFTKKKLMVIDSGGFRSLRPDNPTGKANKTTITANFNWIELDDLVIGNLHGIWERSEVGKRSDKGDTENRLEQSNIIKDFLKTKKKSQVICGDFNMVLDVKSMEILEEGMQNLIRDNNIVCTRSSLYRHIDEATNYSDYILVSKDLKVGDFKVLDIEVSDHLPLVVEIEKI